jgi:hypothetical protein
LLVPALVPLVSPSDDIEIEAGVAEVTVWWAKEWRRSEVKKTLESSEI